MNAPQKTVVIFFSVAQTVFSSALASLAFSVREARPYVYTLVGCVILLNICVIQIIRSEPK